MEPKNSPNAIGHIFKRLSVLHGFFLKVHRGSPGPLTSIQALSRKWTVLTGFDHNKRFMEGSLSRWTPRKLHKKFQNWSHYILLIRFMEKDISQGLLLLWKILKEGCNFSTKKWKYRSLPGWFPNVALFCNCLNSTMKIYNAYQLLSMSNPQSISRVFTFLLHSAS